MQVFWDDDERTILVRRFDETWTWPEYLVCVQKTHQMAQEVRHNVYLIMDCRRVQVIPKGTMSYFNEAHRALPLNVVMRFLTSRSKVLQAIFDLLYQVAPQNFENFHVISTMEEAYKMISKAKTDHAVD